jgi:hypothetical protein
LPEVRPTLFNLDKLQGVETLYLDCISGTEAKPLFALTDKFAEIVRHASPEPIVAAFGCFQEQDMGRAMCTTRVYKTGGKRLLFSKAY